MEVERGAEYFDYLAGLFQFTSASRFCWFGMCFAQTNPREKSKKGASALFLVVLRGISKAGLPREPSEAIRAGKGGTTKRTRPAACGRVRDVQFVPTQIPHCHSFFRPSTALSFSYEKESGVETAPFLARQKRMGRRRQLAPSAHPKWAYGAGKNGPPAQKSTPSACK